MGGLMQENIAITENVVALPFQGTDLADAGAGDLATIQATSLDYVAPFGGSIIGLSVRHNADLTGGVFTFRPTINGTANTGITLTTDDTNQQDYANIEANLVPFSAGDRLGMDWTETGTVAPATTDVAALMFVVFNGMQM